jgi:hypothetical protein
MPCLGLVATQPDRQRLATVWATLGDNSMALQLSRETEPIAFALSSFHTLLAFLSRVNVSTPCHVVTTQSSKADFSVTSYKIDVIHSPRPRTKASASRHAFAAKRAGSCRAASQAQPGSSGVLAWPRLWFCRQKNFQNSHSLTLFFRHFF